MNPVHRLLMSSSAWLTESLATVGRDVDSTISKAKRPDE